MLMIGRQLKKKESGTGWADWEPIINTEDNDRIKIARTLEDEGYLFLADSSGCAIDESFCIITPSERVLTPYEVYTANSIRNIGDWVAFSQLEKSELKKSETYLLMYHREFFNP